MKKSARRPKKRTGKILLLDPVNPEEVFVT